MNEFDKLIKSKLEEQEAPYDPKAWEQLSRRLDHTMPVKGKFTKWIWSTATTIAVLGVAGLIYLNSENHSAHTPSSQDQTQEVVPAVTSSDHSHQENSPQGNVLSDQSAKNLQEKTAERKIYSTAQKNPGFPQAVVSKTVTTNTPTNSIVSPKEDRTVDTRKEEKLIFPSLQATYCMNDIIEIKNDNNRRIIISNGENVRTIQPGEVLALKAKESGNYYLSAGDTKEYLFNILPVTAPDFANDSEMLFDKGLPVNNLKTSSEGKNYQWISNGKVVSTEKEAEMHFYTKGIHSVTLKIENNNGCWSEITKNISVESDYNLLAVTGFNPESSDSRNNTFLPFALLESERNVPFKMEIIDPRTGEVIFETQSASQPWTGVNSKTNQMTPPNSTYIWRVILKEKAKGELKNIYQGTITRI